MRPFIKAKGDVIRFRSNTIVLELLEGARKHGFNINHLVERHSQADWEEFYQLIGYSLAGYHELTLVSDLAALEASKVARSKFPDAGGCRDNGCEIHCGVEREEET